MESILFIYELKKISVTLSSHLNFQLPTASTQNVHSLIYYFNKYYVLCFILCSGDKIGNTANKFSTHIELIFHSQIKMQCNIIGIKICE